MDKVQIAEMESFKGFRGARNAALREFLFHRDIYLSHGVCWPWPKYKSEKGYGVIIFDGFKFAVHRLSFEHFKGLIPKGMVVMHDCDNPPCFNPDHLFLGTQQENMEDMVRKGRQRTAGERELRRAEQEAARQSPYFRSARSA